MDILIDESRFHGDGFQNTNESLGQGGGIAQVAGYGFEPVLSAAQRQEREARKLRKQQFNKVLRKSLEEERLLSTSWCLCSKCSNETLRYLKEAFCCRELHDDPICRRRFLDKLDHKPCISRHDDFQKRCLDHETLEVIAILAAEKFGMENEVDFSSNRTYRFAAYVSYSIWIYGPLGKLIRKIVTTCVVNRIRNEFPEEDGLYTGYKSASEDDE